MRTSSKLGISVLALSLLSYTAHAGDHTYSIGYAPACHHYLDKSDDYNERINLFMAGIDNWVFLTFTNSFRDQAFYAGRSWRTDKRFVYKLFCRINLNAGLLIGYKDRLINAGGVAPMIFPTIEIGYKSWSVETLPTPVLGCMLKYTF
jgi:hypothetical protein